MATLTFKAGASWFAPNVTTIKRNIITAINIVDSYVVTGNEIDSWDASEDNDGSIMCYVTGTILTIAGNGSGTIKFNADQSYWLYSTDGKDYFKNCTSFTGLSLIDTSNCTTLNRSFRGLEKITSLDIDHFDISNVTSLYQTFCYCKKLTSLPIENWDVSNVDTMAYTFYQIGASTLPIENWNVSNLTNLDHTFAHSVSLNNLDLTKWDVSNVTNMNATFCGMKALTSLDLSTWDTSKVTCFPQFVEGCSNLEAIYGLKNFDTSQSVCFAQMFRGCSKLKELDLSSFDTRNADSGTPTSDNGSTSGCTWQMITNTHSLEKITLGKYFTFEGKGVDIVPAEDIGTLPTPSATYIEGADGNWYTEDFTAYAPADVPNLTEMTYYASKKVVNDVIDTRVLNFKGLKHVLASLNTVINDVLNKIDLSGLETKEDAQVKYDTIVEAKADWNQNDPNAIDYVKNRPFYTTDPQPVELCNGTYEFVNSSVTIDENKPFYETSIDYNGEDLVANKEITVVYDGNTYNFTIGEVFVGYNGATMLFGLYVGNISILSEYITAVAKVPLANEIVDTGEPFVLNFASGVFVPITKDSSPTHDISISINKPVDITIPQKYLGVPVWAGEGRNSIVIGDENGVASGDFAVCEGIENEASGNYSHAEGSSTTASGHASHAEGAVTIASGKRSHAEGYDTKATGDCSHAEGIYTTASGYASHAEGWRTTASSDYQHVQGKFNIEDTEKKYVHIVGNGANAGATSNAHTLDWNGNAWFAGNIKIGGTSYDEGVELALKSDLDNIDLSGLETKTDAQAKLDEAKAYADEQIESHTHNYTGRNVEGQTFNVTNPTTNTSSDITAAVGAEIFNNYDANKATGAYSHAEGVSTTAVGNYSHAEGAGTTAYGMYSHAEGSGTRAVGESSHAEGSGTGATGNYSHSEGGGTTASGMYSHAEGSGTRAVGNATHAEGGGTTASGMYSHAEGSGTKASGDYSHAEGYITEASGENSHAEGDHSQATNKNAHAEGSETVASGVNSHAEGVGTLASSPNQHVQGRYNINDTGNMYAHIVGNGTDSSRSNAHTLDWSGNAWFKGNIKVGGSSYSNASELALKSDLDNIDLSGLETKTDAQTKYDEAIAYTDTAVTNLVNSAPETLDTLGELATAFEENAEVVDALNEAIVNKADVGHVHDDRYYTEDEVDAKIDAIPNATFVVTVTKNGDTYTSDKTFAEMLDAHNNGQVIDVRLGSGLSAHFSLCMGNQAFMAFECVDGSKFRLLAFSSDNSVEYEEAAIASQTDLDSLETVVNGKADKATTLAGYGIADAYTKTEVDTIADVKADKEHAHSFDEISGFVELTADDIDAMFAK